MCTGYKVNGELTDQMPFDLTEKVEPIYTEMKGWKTDLTKFTNGDVLPPALQDYIAFIESETGVPISVVSVGPDREQTLLQDVQTLESA